MRKFIFAWLVLLVGSFNVHAQTSFYEGKTIRIVTGYPAGDTNDQWPRLFAQYMPKHIPGNPTIIVQNMPGGGSMIAANYVYSVGKADGLTLGWISPALYFDQLVGRKQVQFNWAKFAWIGSPVESEHQIPTGAVAVGPVELRPSAPGASAGLSIDVHL